MTYESLFVYVPVAILLATLPLMWWARRGRRVDDHPLCRKCGFDLFGKPADSTRCPECGRDVSQPRAIRIGNRQPRRRVLAALSPFLVIPGAWLGLLGYGMFAGTDWNRHKPVGWLIREAQGAEIDARDRALVELLRRTDENALSTAQITQVSDAALSHQGDKSQPWLPAWGNLVERLHDKGRLPPEAWTRYARQALATSMRLHHRTYARRGDSLLVQVHSDPPRLSTATFWLSWNPGDTRPDEFSGHAVPNGKSTAPRSTFCWPDPTRNRFSCGLFAPTPEIEAKLKDGPQTLRVSLNLKAYDSRSSAEPVLEECLRLYGKWALQPSIAPAVRLRTDPALREAMARSITSVTVTATSSAGNDQVSVRVQAGPRPMCLGFVPVFRAGSHEWSSPTSQAIMLLADLKGSKELVIPIDGRLPDSVDVVLRPVPDRIRIQYSIWEIWGEDIVIPNVTVVRKG